MRAIDIAAVLGLAIPHVLAGDAETQGIQLPLPSRPLEWKEVNFISISDSHGQLPSSWPSRECELMAQGGCWDIST